MANGWIQLYNSEYFDFDNPRYDNISIETIGHSLAHQCRYNGHSNGFYSVAEHSVLVSARVFELSGGDDYCALYGLLHDASEALLTDIPRPMKREKWMSAYREWEEEVQYALTNRFMVGRGDFSAAEKFTKQADLEMLATEKEQILSEPPLEWQPLPKPLDYKIECLYPFSAEAVFLDKYYYHIRKLNGKEEKE